MTVSNFPEIRNCHELSHRVEDLVLLFETSVGVANNTRLVPGAAEPLYQPAGQPGEPHCLYSRADYFASALHEVAHWCIAGAARRALVDYGYWYEPDGRDCAAQCAFEAVEARPQALEWLFALAAGHPFRLSLDNLGAAPVGRERFAGAVRREALALCAALPPRARLFREALCRFYGTGAALPTARALADYPL